MIIRVLENYPELLEERFFIDELFFWVVIMNWQVMFSWCCLIEDSSMSCFTGMRFLGTCMQSTYGTSFGASHFFSKYLLKSVFYSTWSQQINLLPSKLIVMCIVSVYFVFMSDVYLIPWLLWKQICSTCQFFYPEADLNLRVMVLEL